MLDQDYYKRLGIVPSAKTDEIKRAYRALVKKYHPDVNKNKKSAEEKLKKINEAYAVLKDARKRREYDQSYNNQAPSQSTTQNFRSVHHFSRRRGIALGLLIFYLLFLSTGFNKRHPFDIKNIIFGSGKVVSDTILQTKNKAMNKFISSKSAQDLLFVAVKKDWYSMIDFLLKNGVNPNLTDEAGYSFLMYAQSLKTAQLLLKNGADVNYQAPNGHTAYTLAIQKKHELAALLRQNGARLIWKKKIDKQAIEKQSKH